MTKGGGEYLERLKIVVNEQGNRVVIIPEIIFMNKQNIDWREVEKYLECYVGELVEISESKDFIYIYRK